MRSFLALIFCPLPALVSRSFLTLEAGWQGEKVCEVLVENESVRTLRCTFPPGIGHEKHYHPNTLAIPLGRDFPHHRRERNSRSNYSRGLYLL